MLLTFHQATPAELPDVIGLLDEAAEWLRSRGIKQWPARFSGTSGWRTERIASYIDDGKCWLVKASDEPIATFSLTTKADADYAEGWPEGPDNALYIFRMAVRRAWAGRDLGSLFLNWASARAEALDLAWLRLDCHRHNRSLQRYYENLSFIRVGTLVRVIDDNGTPYTRGSGALYQRQAGTIFHPLPSRSTAHLIE